MACINEMVTSRCHIVVIESEESAALNSERVATRNGIHMGELWNKFWGGSGGSGGLMLESNSIGGMPRAGVKLAGESE